jgi:hypothetical protein
MASTIKVNNIQNQCGANIANKCGSTITLGASGDTITLACGASQTGFGRTGTVDWDTTAKTASFTAVSGNGYFVNTTSGAVTMTLPATPSAGDIVSVKDYAGTFGTNNLTIARNGSNLDGNAGDRTVSTDFQNFTMVYVDGTQGWISTGSGSDTLGVIPEYICATGGTETTCNNYKIHTFTGPGTFTVNSLGNPIGGPNTVDYLVVAGGGGGGGAHHGAGGGAGGFRESSGAASGCYATSPLGACVSALPVSATTYPITVGGGGAAPGTSPPAIPPTPGSNSVFSSITSTGGGGGAGGPLNGEPGGSGGGGDDTNSPATIGAGNTPPVSPPQGNPGTVSGYGSPHYGMGAGGGATTSGTAGTPSAGGNGGNGATTSISGCSATYAGGGGGSSYIGGAGGAGGPGGGGTGTTGGPSPVAANGTAGTANTGGGGGGGERCVPCEGGKAGGSGIVIIRYRYQ